MSDRDYPILWGRVVPKRGNPGPFLGKNGTRNSMVLFRSPVNAWKWFNFEGFGYGLVLVTDVIFETLRKTL